MDLYAPIKDFFKWLHSLYKSWKIRKQKIADQSVLKEIDILIVLYNQSCEDGTTAKGLNKLEIYQKLPPEKQQSISADDVLKMTKALIISKAIRSATLDRDCNYIITETGIDSVKNHLESD